MIVIIIIIIIVRELGREVVSGKCSEWYLVKHFKRLKETNVLEIGKTNVFKKVC